MLRVTVSGSFHRHIESIQHAVTEFIELGARVLSPTEPRIIAKSGDFLYVASDRIRSVRLVQDRHLEAIRTSDFLWLVAPDGYVGQSASMELGFAVAANVPIFSTRVPADLTLRQYVAVVPDIRSAVDMIRARGRRRYIGPASFLIEPHATLEKAHRTLGEIEHMYLHGGGSAGEDIVQELYTKRDHVKKLLGAAT